MNNGFSRATTVGSNNGPTRSHVLENGVRKSFRAGAQDANIRNRQYRPDILAAAYEERAVRDSKTSGQLLGGFEQFPLAGNYKRRVGYAFIYFLGRAQK